MTISNIHFHPNGYVVSFTNTNKIVPMLSGRYEIIKYKLIPAVNACSPGIYGSDKKVTRLVKDISRFCLLRRKISKQELDEETNRATESAAQAIPA